MMKMMSNNNAKRIMAIDFGDARTGVAVSDETRTLTGDAWVISEKRPTALCRAIIAEADTRGVGLLVVGYPKNMNGTIGPRAVKSSELAESLRELSDIEVILWDERLTTMQAERILINTGNRRDKRKKTIDAVAASLILDSYLKRSSTAIDS